MSDVKRDNDAGRPTLRQERAEVTRRRILDAARALFVRDGYAATTLKAIAAEAGVAVQTVYAVFGSKAAILAGLRDIVVSQPEADAGVRAAMAGPTAEGRLRTFAHSIRARWEHAGDIVKVDQDAVRVDLTLRDGVAAADARRTAGIGRFVDMLDRDLGLGLDVDRTRAIVHALTLYAVYDELVHVHGWLPDAYESWLGEQLEAGVLGRTAP